MVNSSNWLLDGRVQELLAEWAERREFGEEVEAKDLSPEDSKLRERLQSAIERLKQTDWILDDHSDTGDSQSQFPRIDVEQVLRKAEGVPAEELLQRVEELRLLPEGTRAAIRETLTTSDGPNVARSLLEQGLTSYQLLMLCEDRGNELLLGDCLLLEPIGEGGMGRVYKARQLTMDRIVAVKVLNPRTFDSEQGVQRFRREVRTAAQLNHPNIVSAYDAGEDADRHYLVMEYVSGRDLGTLSQRGERLTSDRAVNYVAQAAHALAYAHSQGVVHRDVKPTNLLVDSKGTVKVLDLGLARSGSISADEPATHASELTSSGQVMGTIDYLAPEQAVDSRNADERSDVYSLGCTLYSLLHGRPVYDRKSVVNRLLAHQSVDAPSLSSGRADVPDGLNDVFLKMIVKDPQQRYQSMGDVIADLEAIRNQKPIRRTGKPHERRFGRRLLLSCAGAAIVIALLFVIVAVLRPDAGATTREANRDQARPQIRDRETADLPSQPPALAAVPFDLQQARAHQEAWAEHLGVPVEYTNSIGMVFQLIPPGEFVMGTSQDDIDARLQFPDLPAWRRAARHEFPPHGVRITQPYYVAIHEVTQKQYATCGLGKPSYFSPTGAGRVKIQRVWSDEFPVENVDWFDALRFCIRLSHREQIQPAYELQGTDVTRIPATGYRLPTEAEWEFAARAGSDQDYCFTGDEVHSNYAWSDKNSRDRTHPVGVLRSNAFGLYDVHGNVFEWCWDGFAAYPDHPVTDPQGPTSGDFRVHRSGSWDNRVLVNRSAMRSSNQPIVKNHRLGFRVVLPVEAVRGK